MHPTTKTQFMLLSLGFLIIQGIGVLVTAEKVWCIAKPGAPEAALQKALDYACGDALVNCKDIQEGSLCFYPNNFLGHASFAFNMYYQAYGRNSWNCYFSGLGLVVTEDPSYGSCIYPSS